MAARDIRTPAEAVTGHVAPPLDGHGMTWRVGALVAVAAACAVVAFSGPPLRDSLQYFDFADVRRLAGIPNALNVLSSAAFVVVGLAGVATLLGRQARFRDPRERAPWVVFFSGVVLAGIGTGSFHLAPSADSLGLDRFPMTVGFTGLFAALVAERIDVEWGRRLLWPLVGLGLGSIVYWYVSDRSGAGDLRPYFLVQFFSLLAIPLLLLIFPARYSGSGVYLVALGAYLLGKVAEAKDVEIYRAGGIVSGHTLKHLLAAVGIGAIAWMVGRRAPRDERHGTVDGGPLPGAVAK
jgi:hypothetical protein